MAIKKTTVAHLQELAKDDPQLRASLASLLIDLVGGLLDMNPGNAPDDFSLADVLQTHVFPDTVTGVLQELGRVCPPLKDNFDYYLSVFDQMSVTIDSDDAMDQRIAVSL